MKLPRYSLRTLFAFCTLAGIVCAWVACQLNCIRQRHQFMETHSKIFYDEPTTAAAPWQLRLFGEKSREMMGVWPGDVDLARRLFPETNIIEFNPRKSR
jgi:hypothetical protein